MPARARRTSLRSVLAPLVSLLLLAAITLLGPAAVATPSPAGAGQAQPTSASSPVARKRHGHHHKHRHHKHKRKKPAQGGATQSGGSSSRVERAASIALQQLGDPYRYGSAGPNSFDCSGLMQYSFAKAGIKIPRTAAAQSARAHRIPRSKLRRGDLLYFSNGGRVYHTAMFLKWSHGAVQMVDAPGTGKSVRITRPWTNSWFAGSMR